MQLDDCDRLRDSLASNSQDFLLSYALQGQVNMASELRLNLQIDAILPCVCQRCLENVNITLGLNFHYVINSEAAEELDKLDDVDWLEADMEMDLTTLIEDEVLAAFPFAPMHLDCNAVTMQSGDNPNPFAVLQALKDKPIK